MHVLHLEITSDPVNLAPVRRAVEAYCASCGFDEKAVGEVGLCVNEALANITRHAYQGKTDRPIHVDADFIDSNLEVTLRDWGNGVQPSSTLRKRDPLTPGGLGLICLRSLMDDLVFIPQPDGMVLKMKRQLKPKDDEK